MSSPEVNPENDLPVTGDINPAPEVDPTIAISAKSTDASIGHISLVGDSLSSPEDDTQLVELGGPGEVLAERALPSLLERLEHSYSIHTHNYGERAARDDVKAIQQKDSSSLTAEDAELLNSIAVLAEFTGLSTYYQYIYTAGEINNLAGKLSVLRGKNRPDFDGIEGDLIDVCSALLRGDPKDYTGDAKKIRGIIKRAVDDGEGRRGMQFGTMVDAAKVANDILSTSFNSDERQEYLLHATDPDKSEGTDLSAVYQFVVNYNAYQIMMDRSMRASALNQTVYENNCGIINSYFEEVRHKLDSIPTGIKLQQQTRVSRTGRTGTRQHNPKRYLLNLKDSMNERLANGNSGSGVSKGYKLDPMGAYRLQRLIAHTIEALNTSLTQSARNQTIDIIPLDELDLDDEQ